MVPRSDNSIRSVTHRHWLPIVTFCPVNNLPDLIYVSVEFQNAPLAELYQLRKRIRKVVAWKKMYMEDVAEALAREFSHAHSVTVSLAFNRHVVKIYNKP